MRCTYVQSHAPIDVSISCRGCSEYVAKRRAAKEASTLKIRRGHPFRRAHVHGTPSAYLRMHEKELECRTKHRYRGWLRANFSDRTKNTPARSKKPEPRVPGTAFRCGVDGTSTLQHAIYVLDAPMKLSVRRLSGMG